MENNLKAVLKCSNDLKLTFKNSSCILTISVGQEVHEGEKFLKTIEVVNESFKNCIILIDDTLQRHTMALNNNEDADFFHHKSFVAGDRWLERNKKYYKRLDILKEIVRWDDWLSHVHYNTKLQEIKKLIEEDAEYAKSFELTIKKFLDRYSNRLENLKAFDIPRAKKLCKAYLVEECTVMCLLEGLNCNFEVYPGKRNLAMDMTHKKIIAMNNPNILNAVSIKFINRRQLRPQCFEPLKEITPLI